MYRGIECEIYISIFSNVAGTYCNWNVSHLVHQHLGASLTQRLMHSGRGHSSRLSGMCEDNHHVPNGPWQSSIGRSHATACPCFPLLACCGGRQGALDPNKAGATLGLKRSGP